MDIQLRGSEGMLHPNHLVFCSSKFISEHDLHNSFGRDFFEEDWEIDSPIVQLRDLVPCG